MVEEERVCLEGGLEGSGVGRDPGARVTTGGWIGHARRSSRTSEPGDEVSSSSHLLGSRAAATNTLLCFSPNLIWRCGLIASGGSSGTDEKDKGG